MNRPLTEDEINKASGHGAFTLATCRKGEEEVLC